MPKHSIEQKNLFTKIIRWSPVISTIITTTTLGYIMSTACNEENDENIKFQGTILGALAGVTDSILPYYDKNYSHFFSRTIFNSIMLGKTFQFILGNSISDSARLVSYALSTIGGATLTRFTVDWLDFKQKVQAPLEHLEVLYYLLGPKDLKIKNLETAFTTAYKVPIPKSSKENIDILKHDISAFFNNPVIKNSLVSVCITTAQNFNNALFFSILGNYLNDNFIIACLSENNNHDISPFNLFCEGIKVIGLLTIKRFLDQIANLTHKNNNNNLEEFVLHNITEIIMGDRIGTEKLLNLENREQRLSNLQPEIKALLWLGPQKINNVLQSFQSFFITFPIVFSGSSGALGVYFILTLMSKYLAKIRHQTLETEDHSYKLKYQIEAMNRNILHNFEAISLRDGNGFAKNKINILIQKSKELTGETLYALQLKAGLIQIMISTLTDIIDLFYFGYNIYAKNITLAQIPLLKRQLESVIKFLQGDSSSHINIAIGGSQTTGNLKELIKILSDPQSSPIEFSSNNKDLIKIEYYSLELNNQKIVEIKDIEFHSGKAYAITGASGCGKTTFLKTFKIPISTPFKYKGSVSLPTSGDDQKTKILFIDQNSYIPPNVTLLELSAYPYIYQNLTQRQQDNIRKLVQSLFKKIQIDDFVNSKTGLINKLDSQDYSLSGGQVKKLNIIQAIVTSKEINPDIKLAIFDEILVGLDHESIKLVESALKEHLLNNNITILIVDHQAKANNYNNFYEKVLYIPSSGEDAYFTEIRAQAQLPADHDPIILGDSDNTNE